MKARHLVRLRRISQVLFFSFFLFLFIQSRLPQKVYLEYSLAFSGVEDLRIQQPIRFFFQLDPLVAITSLLSGYHLIKGFLWAVGILLLTLLLGRVFCGFICPFGTVHHFVGWIRPSLKGKRMTLANQWRPSQRVKYFLVLALVIGAALGLNASGLMDPISLLFRSLALSVFPALGSGLRSIFETMAASEWKVLNLLSYGAEVVLAPVFGYEPRAYQSGWLIGGLFLAILLLNRVRPRFWCRVLCPLGALLGLLSRFSLLKLEKDPEKCTDCKLCVKRCQGAATPIPGEAWEASECLTCFNCFNACPQDALSFRVKWSPGPERRPDMGRRAVLGGVLAGVSLPLLGRIGGQIDKVADARLIRPPGSLSEKRFVELCQRCGLCMKVCPTNVINPTIGEAGMAGFWTPRLIMTMGYCEYTCTLCGSACPTGAIKELTAKEKIGRPVKIGSAFVDRGRCLPWSGNAPCIVCEEHCPTSPKAIRLQKDLVRRPNGEKMPVQKPLVDLRKCVGCGICENKCPVRGMPAIRVIAAGESRSLKNQILL